MKTWMRCVGIAVILGMTACGGDVTPEAPSSATEAEPADEPAGFVEDNTGHTPTMEPETPVTEPEDTVSDAMEPPVEVTPPEQAWPGPEERVNPEEVPVGPGPPRAREPAPLHEAFGACARDSARVTPPQDGFVGEGLVQQLRVDERGAVHTVTGDRNAPSTYHVWTGEAWASLALPVEMVSLTVAAQGFPVMVRRDEARFEVLCLDADLETWHSVMVSNPAETFLPGTLFQMDRISVELTMPRHGNTKLTYQFTDYALFAEDEAMCDDAAQNNWCQQPGQDCCTGLRVQEVVEDLTAATTELRAERPNNSYDHSYSYSVEASSEGHDGIQYGFKVTDRFDAYHGYYVGSSSRIWMNDGAEPRTSTSLSWSLRAGSILNIDRLHNGFVIHMDNMRGGGNSASPRCVTLTLAAAPLWAETLAGLGTHTSRALPSEEGSCSLGRSEWGTPLTVIHDLANGIIEVEDVVLELAALPQGKTRVTFDAVGDLHLLYTDRDDLTLKRYAHIPRFDRMMMAR